MFFVLSKCFFNLMVETQIHFTIFVDEKRLKNDRLSDEFLIQRDGKILSELFDESTKQNLSARMPNYQLYP